MRYRTLTTISPGTVEWQEHYSPEAKAERQARDRKRERIIEDARAKGWRRWGGNYFFHLEKRLRAIGCRWPDVWVDELRDERQFELDYEAKMKARKTRALDA